jgi:hypothetical protein
VRVSWTPYANPATYLPVRVSGSAQTFGGTAGGQLSRSLTDVQWLPPSPGNVARTLVTIPAGFRQYLGPAGGQ